MDFILSVYKELLQALQLRDFLFLTFSQYIEQQLLTDKRLIILRHDVEARYGNALRMAEFQHSMGIRGSYYFRITGRPGNEEVIRKIAALGHEIGYHYDDLSVCRGNHEKAMERFQANLAYLRRFAPVTTITMEGAPLSRYDNREIWKKYDYRSMGILAEPYFDIDFNELFYITDTGRRWDGHLYNVRDKATKENPVTNPEFLKLRYHSTHDIIRDVENNDFPRQSMLNFHPQRWHDKPLPWIKELFWQNAKNQVKRMLVNFRN